MGEPRFITIGRVLKPKGLSGEVKISPAVVPLEDYGNLGSIVLYLGNEKKALHVERASHNNKFVYLKFSSVSTVEEAEALRDGLLLIEEDKLADLPDGTYYQSELVGFRVLDETGHELGRVQDVVDYPSCDALEVVLPGGKEILVPMTKGIVHEIRREKKEISLFAKQIEELLQNS